MKLDFPFYNDNPKIKALDCLILAIVPIFYTFYVFFPFEIPFGLGAFAFCFSHLFAFLYVARGKISLIVKKLKFRDVVRVVVTLILQFLFAILLSAFLKFVLHVTLNGNAVTEMKMNIVFWIKVIVQLFGEELYKILLFLVTLTLMYKFTKKRKLSIIVAVIVSLCFFAVIHATTYNSLIQIFLLQGLASVFCFYNYLKSKNILTSYLQHLLFDAIPFILVMIHVI